jgi:hypothetical protein
MGISGQAAKLMEMMDKEGVGYLAVAQDRL